MDAPSFAFEPGDLVQLNPKKVVNKAFGGCILVVDEQRSWGVLGYVQALGNSRDELGGQAYYRASWDEMEPLRDGRAVWVVAQGTDEPY